MPGTWNGDEVAEQFRAAALRATTRAIGYVEAEWVRLITSGPKSGAVYDTLFYTIGTGPTRRVVSYGSRPAHQASAPGEAPASDTSYLVNNRTVTVTVEGERYSGVMTVHAGYALFLELGTDRMEPRPAAMPALINTRAAVLAAFGEEMGRVFR